MTVFLIQIIKVSRIGLGICHPNLLQRGFNLLALFSITAQNIHSIQLPSCSGLPAFAHTLTPPLSSFTFATFFSLCFYLLLGDVMVKLSFLCKEMFSPCRNMREWCSRLVPLSFLTRGAQVQVSLVMQKYKKACTK